MGGRPADRTGRGMRDEGRWQSIEQMWSGRWPLTRRAVDMVRRCEMSTGTTVIACELDQCRSKALEIREGSPPARLHSLTGRRSTLAFL